MLVTRYVMILDRKSINANLSECTSMKLGCDGNNPCKTCRHKKIECKFSRLESKGLSVKRERESNRASLATVDR